MLHCNEVTRLYSTDEIRRASLRTWVAVRIHLMMCRFCRRYVRELTVIGETVRRVTRSAPEDPEQLDRLVHRMLQDARDRE